MKSFNAARAIDAPREFPRVERWVVFWMREAAATLPGTTLPDLWEDLLARDNEGLIALSVDTLDVLFSIGGHNECRLGKREVNLRYVLRA